MPNVICSTQPSSLVLASNFSKTDETLANITSFTIDVVGGKTYKIEATLYTTSNVAGGIKMALAGSATATAVIYEAVVFQTAVAAQSRATALGTAVGAVTAVTTAQVRLTGSILVNATGTLAIQFARNAAVGTSVVLGGSTLKVEEAVIV